MADAWDYKRYKMKYTNGDEEDWQKINELGKNGWELVSLVNSSSPSLPGAVGAVFKRKCTTSPTQSVQRKTQVDNDYPLDIPW